MSSQSKLIFTDREGVRLAHFESEPTTMAGPPLVLIHGWIGDHNIFSSQIDHFSKARRTAAINLRGHGFSDAPEQEYTVSGFADDVAFQCRMAGIEKPVIIGSSFGGSVALDLCGRYPAFASGLVMIDSMIMVPAHVRSDRQVQNFLDQLGGPDYTIVVRNSAWSLGKNFDAIERRQFIFDNYILTACEKTPQHVAYSSMNQFLKEYDPLPAARNCKIPMAYISADVEEIERARDLELLRTICPQLVTAKTLLAGHFSTIEVSDQINAMLERFLLIGLKPIT